MSESTPSETSELLPVATPLVTPVATDTAAELTVDPLVDQVQSFLQQRETLARKLADEIAATEKKLADLKRTAALLYPEKTITVGKDRKPKKLKKARTLPDKTTDAEFVDSAATIMETE